MVLYIDGMKRMHASTATLLQKAAVHAITWVSCIRLRKWFQNAENETFYMSGTFKLLIVIMI